MQGKFKIIKIFIKIYMILIMVRVEKRYINILNNFWIGKNLNDLLN
jgi:hypothetical protein